MVYIFKLTHYAIGGVAVQCSRREVRHFSSEAVWSCGYRLPLAGVPLLRALLPHGTSTLRGRWHKSAASAGVNLQTPFPPCCSRLRTLRRLLHAPGLAGGFQQAVKSFCVVTFAVNLFPTHLVACLAALSGYATPSTTWVRAQLADAGWR